MEESKNSTMEQICGIIEKANVDCHWCGQRLRGQDVGYYDHDGGVQVEDFEKRQWIYFVCSNCGYQWALWKLLKRIQNAKKIVSANSLRSVAIS